MKNANVPYGRAPQILKFLIEHGPLSIRGLSEILEPKMDLVSLRRALGRLYLKKLLIKRNDNLFRGAGVFYDINQLPRVWPEVSAIVGNHSSTSYKNEFRPIEYTHSEITAVWAEKIKRILPDTIILRDFKIKHSELAKEYLLSNGNDYELNPDFILFSTTHNNVRKVCIAFEIERYNKTTKRLIRKLKKYANESHVDGVVYICDNEALAKRILKIYNAFILKDALRINNYGNNFILFKETTNIKNIDLNAFNCIGQSTNILEWILKLLNHDFYSRHDSIFNNGTPGCRSLSTA